MNIPMEQPIAATVLVSIAKPTAWPRLAWHEQEGDHQDGREQGLGAE